MNGKSFFLASLAKVLVLSDEKFDVSNGFLKKTIQLLFGLQFV